MIEWAKCGRFEIQNSIQSKCKYKKKWIQ